MTDFFVAAAGAAAALAGLLFVGLSINLARIIGAAGLPERAAETLILLGAALVSALIGLAPFGPAAQASVWLAVGALTWLAVTRFHLRSLRRRLYDTLPHGIQRIALAQAATIPLVAGPALLLAGHDAGRAWVVAGLILPLVVSLQNAWVLLVEILR